MLPVLMATPSTGPGSPIDCALPHVRELHAYVPGAQPEGEGWTKLNTNELPYPPPPEVVAAVSAAAAQLPFYPSPTAARLRAELAAFHGVQPSQILVGNGSDDVLNLLVRVFVGPGRAAGWTVPSYSLYPTLVAINGGEMRAVPLARAIILPAAGILASGANLFFLTVPNAPTGVTFPTAAVRDLAAHFEGMLVLDEAYADFAGESMVPLVADFPRVIVVRTFSKSYGLAGARVGYAVAHADTIALLDRVRDSYNVDRLAQAAALAALSATSYYRECVTAVVASREAALARLRAWGWPTWPSVTNFVLTEPRNARGETGPAVARAAYEALSAHRVLVRYFPHQPLTAAALRISVGTPAQMDILFQHLEAWRTAEQPQ